MRSEGLVAGTARGTVDQFNFGVLLRNLRSITGHYLDAGATHPVLAGVGEDQHERKLLADAV